jgi:hypothetical protein
MHIRFKVNLGSSESSKLALDFRQCRVGDRCEVSDAVGESLVKRGIAEEIVIKAEAKPAPIAGVPKKELPKAQKPEPKPEPTPEAKPAEAPKPTK